MSMSNERLTEIHEHVMDAFRGLEVKGNTGWAGIVVLTDATELLTEVKRLKESLTITDEMVERAAEACYLASDEGPSFCPKWDDVCERFPTAAALYRRDAHAVLKAALGVEK